MGLTCSTSAACASVVSTATPSATTPTAVPDANAECAGAIGALLSEYRSSSADT